MLFSLLIKARSLLERIYGGILFIPEKAVEEVITRGPDHFFQDFEQWKILYSFRKIKVESFFTPDFNKVEIPFYSRFFNFSAAINKTE